MSDDVNEAAVYSNPEVEFNGKKYYVVFQCRVRPSSVMSPTSKPEYYTIENPDKDIRPYRILFKEYVKE